eukprot:TRINITY_DN19827_c0_g1_i2.p1 TRINITY_DN19827_c0_g1~~TRINITY_DN19827_c0_g1_i2.p1  ORF type:complete len:239 (-),score=39.34 TRINITY_DN19827_c0_g1_i2:57-752(-)
MADLSARGLWKSDTELKTYIERHDLVSKYYTLAASDAISRAKAALEAKGHVVRVVDRARDVPQVLKEWIPEGASVCSPSSTTLEETGVVRLLKDNPSKWENIKAEIVAAPIEKQPELYRKGATADYFLTSATAVTENGEITNCCYTGTRCSGFMNAARVVVIVGSQKIVSDAIAARKRTYEFCLPLESARVRSVYRLPESAVNYYVKVSGTAGPDSKGRYSVIIVKELLGF